MTRREYKGAAQAAVLTAALGGSTADVQLICSDLTNWPTGVGSRPFFVVVDRGKATEEKILCSSRTGNVLTVFDNGITNGRAADGTAITAHSINAIVEHVFTATDADEANDHINKSTGVHGIADTADLIQEGDPRLNDARTPTEHAHAQADVTGLVAALADKAPTASPTFTGTTTVASPTAAGSTGARQITMSTADPSGGADGDVWLKYV